MKMLRGILFLVGGAALCACGTADDSYYDDGLEFRSDDGGVIVPPRPPGSIANGLESPNVTGINPAFGLDTPAGMAESFGLLEDSDLRDTAEYLVECALPLGRSITKTVDGQTVVLGGLLGLAPEWETEACDQDCQEWVSACLLARTNISGQTVHLWLAGDHEGLGWEAPAGAVLEAGFYGNLFVDSETQYLCKGSGLAVVEAQRAGRTCSWGSGGACDLTTYANCTNHSRCVLDGPNQNVPTNCKAGSQASSAPFHTIASYVVP